MKLFKCEGGAAVGNPIDANPKASGLDPDGDQVTLYASEDGGRTWEDVGYFQRSRFGGWGFPEFHDPLG